MKTSKTKNRNCPVCSGSKTKYLGVVNKTNIVRCTNCSMVFADVANSEIDEKNIYSEDSFFKYIQNEPIYSLAFYDLVLLKIQKHFKNKKIKILEFGCGPGLFLRRAKLMNIEAFGCDFSPYSKLANKYFNLNITIDNIFNAGFKNNEFDVVITHATHEHLGNMYGISKKLYELLKPDGIFIISGVPNYNTIPIKTFNNFTNNQPPSHVNYFEKKSLIYLYKKLKLNTISIKTYGVSAWSWQLIIKLKKIFSKSKQVKIRKTNFNKEKIKEEKITTLHKIIVFIYIYFHIPKMGRNIEIWGIK